MQSSAIATAAAGLISPIYSINVGGKNYSGDIEKSGKLYDIAVPNSPGASANGFSAEAAENALNAKLDILV